MRKLALAAVLVASFAACGALVAGCTSSNTPLTPSNAKGGVEFPWGFVIYADEQILASFDSNPSTGFDWMVAIEGDALEQVGDKTFASSDKTGVAAGAPGVMELVFKDLKAGMVVMIFKNARSWEDNVTDIYYRVRVTLGASGAVESMEGAELPNPLKVL